MILTASSRYAPLAIIAVVNIALCASFSPSSTSRSSSSSALPLTRGLSRIPSRDSAKSRPLLLQRRNHRATTFSPSSSYSYSTYGGIDSSSSSTSLSMGAFDFLRGRNSRDEGDFVPLDRTDDGDVFGPGPLILMYAVPASILDDELMDMVEDGMPRRAKVVVRRLGGNDDDDDDSMLLDSTVGEALDMALSEKSGGNVFSTGSVIPVPTTSGETEGPCPVLYFSGASNGEMMETYDIIAKEIYEETRGVHWPACAKVVPPAMGKTLRQVLDEISGDHADAMRMRREEEAKLREEGLPGHDMPL